MRVRVFQPAKTAMQSGRANTRRWVLEFEPSVRREADPLMGWTSSSDTRRQLRIYFDSREEAVAHAERNGFAYAVEEPRDRRIRPKSYAENFRYDRIDRWTH